MIDRLENETFARLLVETAKRGSASPAMRAKRRGIWHTTTWRDLLEQSSAIACALKATGVTRGGCVAVLGDYTPHMQVALAATHAVGAVALPLYPFTSSSELVGPLRQSRAAVVFAENQEQVDKLLEVADQLPDLKRIVFDEDRGMHHYAQSQLTGYMAFIETGREIRRADATAIEREIAAGSPDDPAFAFLSPGAAGEPRMVMHTHRSMLYPARAAVAADKLSASDVTMAYLPPGWIAQIQVAYAQSLVTGYCVCCPESGETTLSDIREIAPTYLLATPRVIEAIMASVARRVEAAGGFNLALYRSGMAVARRVEGAALARSSASIADKVASFAYSALLYAPLRDALGLSRIKAAYTAGDVIEPSMLLSLRALGVNLKQLYGTTDTGYFVAMHRTGAADPATVGPPADGVDIEIGAGGEIQVRMAGLSSAAKSDGLWIDTGDVGRVDGNGHLVVVDRKRDVIQLASGARLAPRQIENRLKSIPFVKEAVVFGDGKSFVSALVDIDVDFASRFADAREANYTGRAELAALDIIHDAIGEAIARLNASLANDPDLSAGQIARFAVLQAELAPHTGTLTRIGTLRRGAIAKTYADVIAAFYDGRTSVSLSDLSEIEGHTDELVRHQLKIRDVAKSTHAAKAAA